MGAPAEDLPTPALLLDVDGVLNGLCGVTRLPQGWVQLVANGYLISWDPTITARLRCWHESGRVALHWLTTWGADADRLLAGPMGLPTGLPVLADPGRQPSGHGTKLRGAPQWWKLTLAREAVARQPGRRVVWVDDDLGDGAAETARWLADHPQVLAVAPDLYRGVTHPELDAVENWLARWPAGPTPASGPPASARDGVQHHVPQDPGIDDGGEERAVRLPPPVGG